MESSNWWKNGSLLLAKAINWSRRKTEVNQFWEDIKHYFNVELGSVSWELHNIRCMGEIRYYISKSLTILICSMFQVSIKCFDILLQNLNLTCWFVFVFLHHTLITTTVNTFTVNSVYFVGVISWVEKFFSWILVKRRCFF